MRLLVAAVLDGVVELAREQLVFGCVVVVLGFVVAAVAGGLAGIVYGEEGVPASWRQVLCKREEIRQLCVRFCENNPGIGRAPEEKKSY